LGSNLKIRHTRGHSRPDQRMQEWTQVRKCGLKKNGGGGKNRLGVMERTAENAGKRKQKCTSRRFQKRGAVGPVWLGVGTSSS